MAEEFAWFAARGKTPGRPNYRRGEGPEQAGCLRGATLVADGGCCTGLPECYGRARAFANVHALVAVPGWDKPMSVVLVESRDRGRHRPPRRASSSCRTRISAGNPPLIM